MMESLEYDVVIVGGGPAGITLSRELGARGIEVCLLEAGGKSKSLRNTEISSSDIQIRQESRERVLGGASSVWGGVIRELDERDLIHPDHPWPMSYYELKKYYEKVYKNYLIPRPVIDKEYYSSSLFANIKGMETFPFVADLEPIDFGKAYYDELKAMPSVHLELDFIVTKLNFDSESDKVTSVSGVSTYHPNQNSKRVYGKVFVLACGGIENARLLLDSGYKDIYSSDSALGCYFMDHPKGVLAEIKCKQDLPDSSYFWGVASNNKNQFVGLSLSDVPLGEARPYIRLFPRYSWSGYLNIKRFVKLFLGYSFFIKYHLKFFNKTVLVDESEADTDTDFNKRNRSVSKTILEFSKYVFFRLTPFEPKIKSIAARVVVESLPNINNRICIGELKDDFGRALPIINYSLGEKEKKSINQLICKFYDGLKDKGFGDLQLTYFKGKEEICLRDASHHCGTTRMGINPSTSVVNQDCRFHCVDNLYAVGSSVFPTSGFANPTLTIIALSIRLSDYLSGLYEK